MLAGIVDHLWQSVAFSAILACLAFLIRRNSAALQLWLWRIAALKFLLPFAWLYALGGWLGFPVRHSAIPPPHAVSQLVSNGLSIAAPAGTLGWGPVLTALALMLLAVTAAACLWFIRRQLKHARQRRDEEATRMEADFDFQPVPLNFWQSALLSSVTLLTVSLPMIAGATRDRQWRQQMLAIDQQAMLAAKISMTEIPDRFGEQTLVTVDNDGVLIHNTNIKDLVSLVYGVGTFEIFGGSMPWLSDPHYDVRITGAVRAPELFDPYSLHEPVTNYLYAQFGVSIRINGSCQKPCKDFESFVIERLPRCAHPLGRNACAS
jgi:hypothetical protein